MKTMPGAAQVVEFDPHSQRLLMNRSGRDAQGATWSRTTLWDLTTDQAVIERDLGQGVLAFQTDGTPLQLSWVAGQRAESLLRGELILAKIGAEIDSSKTCQRFRSPLEGLSDFRPITLSHQGSRLAAVAWPVRKQGDKFIVEGGVSTIAIWDVDARWDAGFKEPIRILKHKATQDLALSPDGRLLAAWDKSGEITVWTLPDGKEFRRFRVGRVPVSCLVFGRDPVWHEDDSVPPWLLAVGESSGLITVWDLSAHRPRSTCRGSEFGVHAMDFMRRWTLS